MKKKSTLYEDGEYYDKISNYTLDDEIWCNLTEGKKCILELCCGTGRVIMKLLPYHNDITGIDNSTAMLNLAKTKIIGFQDRVHLYRRTITRFNLGRTFDSILLINSSFSHLYTKKEVVKFLSCLKKHMTKDSEFILETTTKNILQYHNLTSKLMPSPGANFIDKRDGKSIEVSEKSAYNSETRLIKQDFYYYKENKLMCKKSIYARIFNPSEIQDLFIKNGFYLIKEYSGYNCEPFDSLSRIYITVIKKK